MSPPRSRLERPQPDPNEIVKWDLLAALWANYMHPCRPDRTDLNLIRRILDVECKRPSGVSVLVLGSTPELRDLAARTSSIVTVMDQNPRMITRMRELQATPNDREIHVVDDWLRALPRAQHRYDVILSDLTQSNVPYEARETFYQGIAQSLVPGGVFVDRIFQYDDDVRPFGLAAIAQHHARLPAYDMSTLNELLFKLLASDAVARDGVAHLGALYRALLDMKPRSAMLQRQVGELSAKLAPGTVTWHWGRHWDEIRKDYPGELQLEHAERRGGRYLRGIPALQAWRRS